MRTHTHATGDNVDGGVGVGRPTWKLVSPFLDKVTRDKVLFFTQGNAADMARIAEVFDVRVLERRVGGEFAFEWHFETYWEHVNALPERLASAPPVLTAAPDATASKTSLAGTRSDGALA
jgi:hypothetical protein